MIYPFNADLVVEITRTVQFNTYFPDFLEIFEHIDLNRADRAIELNSAGRFKHERMQQARV
jgi:hypothetical protein